MDYFSLGAFEWYSWVILPLIIFLARILDVSLGTLRVIMISKGYRKYAPLLGFFEVLVWIIAIKEIFDNVDNFITIIMYAAGFAAGTYIGMYIEDRFSKGKYVIQVTARKNANRIISLLRKKKFRVTSINAMGKKGPLKIIYTVVDKKRLKEAIELIKKNNRMAFYTIEELKHARDKIPPKFAPKTKRYSWSFLNKKK